MKWFKHDSAASLDAKLARVRLKYGMEGYGLYWFCLESIARNVETHNLTFELEEDAELLSVATNIHYERVQEMMTYMVNLSLFENCDGRITCLKMATRTDEYTQKLLRTAQSVPTVSRHAPDKVPPNRREEKRRDKKRIEKQVATAPDFVNQSAWSEWVEYRKQSKKKMTPATVTKQVSFLAKYDMVIQAMIINQSIQNGWAGLFEPKGATNGIQNPTNNSRQPGYSGRPTKADEVRAARERARLRDSGGQSDLGSVVETQ